MSRDRLSFQCNGCANHIHGTYFTLLRNIERTVEVDAATVETITSDSESLAVFCPSCGPAPAFTLLERHGIERVAPEADPADRPCSKCGVATVAEAEKHAVYVVAEEAIVDGVCIDTLELLSISAVCVTCSSPHECGSTFDVASVLGVAPAANDACREGDAS